MKCEYCGYDGDGFEEGEFGFWCPDCQGLLYKNGKEDYSQADIILEKPVSDHRPIIQKSRLKKQLAPDRSAAALYQRKEIFCRSFLWRSQFWSFTFRIRND